MNLITFLIKGLVISGYDPAEDMIEGGIDYLSNPLRSLVKKYRESVNIKLKKENFIEEQIKTGKREGCCNISATTLCICITVCYR